MKKYTNMVVNSKKGADKAISHTMYMLWLQVRVCLLQPPYFRGGDPRTGRKSVLFTTPGIYSHPVKICPDPCAIQCLHCRLLVFL